MELKVHFAKPVSIFDNFINKCVGKYCHCETSIRIDASLLCVMIDTAISEAYAPSYLEKLLKKMKLLKGKVEICFYILWNDVVSIRFFNRLGDDFHNPTDEVYDTIVVEINSIEHLKEYIIWNLCQVGKPYDFLSAACLFLPVTLKNEMPQKFFCSQLVMHGLREIGLQPDTDINHMKPDDVYEWLTIKVTT